MNTSDRVRNALYLAIDEVNRLQPAEQQLPRDEGSILIGPQSPLSSLGLVNFVVAAEEQIDAEFNHTVPLTELVSGDESSHFATLGTLSDYLSGLLESCLQQS